MSHVLKLASLGILSGALSYLGFVKFDGYEMYIPGIVFGVVTAIYFIFYIKKYFHLIIWIAISALGYWLAVYITLSTPFAYLSFFMGGIIGASSLIMGSRILSIATKRRYYIVFILLGGLLGLSFYLGEPLHVLLRQVGYWYNSFFPIYAAGPDAESYFALFVVWQMGMAGTLGFMLNKARKES